MQNELFEYITKVLDLGRRCRVETDDNNKQKMKFELLNHKIFIWINLDRNNCVQEDLREQCNIYINFVLRVWRYLIEKNSYLIWIMQIKILILFCS